MVTDGGEFEALDLGIVYRGEYSSKILMYHNLYRLDVVKYSDVMEIIIG